MYIVRKLGKVSHFIKQRDLALPPLIVNSIPKSGTNLVERIMIGTGYRRAMARCLNEFNINSTRLRPRPGILYLAHLARDCAALHGQLRVLNVERPLFPCIRSYLNYMFIDTRHMVSEFLRADMSPARVETLLFTPDNPLGRPLVDEYLRFYVPGVFDPDCTVNYDSLISREAREIAKAAAVIGVNEATLATALEDALGSTTSTKNKGRINPFADLPEDFRESLRHKLTELEDRARHG